MVRPFAHVSTGAKVPDIPSLVFSLSMLSSADPVSGLAAAAQKERLPSARKAIDCRRKTICGTQQIEPLAGEGV
ncbi:hypothetical protein SAMN05192564_102665 [Paraburkholderia sartisoli]|uniref:Uncharacterized protein n=1 Tax=Paraburkholderia sartisoli TaxID=83784 RepID=A0A1H4D4F5_9BURK|nr:hypothetical protein SAMN05192564_102665 [Paraburkholderia sartisoli]